MTNRIAFTVLDKPQPQGSTRGFVIPGKGGAKPRAIVTSDNKKMKPFRQQLSWAALQACEAAGISGLFADKHVPVAVEFKFYFAKPLSISKKRTKMVVRPDLDKICRSTCDSLTGILWVDDAQIVQLVSSKHYGLPERAEIEAVIVDNDTAHLI
jgi:Holliday junction resolvase RusA-like endonuclease